MFLFPLHPGVERTGEQTIQIRRQKKEHPGHAQGVVRASFSWPPFPIFFLPCLASFACACGFFLPCLALLPLAAAANTPTRHIEAALPSCPPNFKFVRLPTEAGAQTRHRYLLTSHREQATTHLGIHSYSALRCVPRPASYGNQAPGRPIILLLPLGCSSWGRRSSLFP